MSGGIRVNTKRIFGYLSWGFGFILVALLLVYIVFQLFAPDLTVRVFGFKPYIVLTGSMEPVINENDMVVVKRFDVDELEVGDIITFRADINYDGVSNEIVTHYIYTINDTGEETLFRTRRYFENEDDYSADPWVLGEDDILGLCSFHVPWIGMIGRFLQTPFGIAAIVVNIGVIGGIIYLIKYNNAAQPSKEDSA
jgi:signal peptidase